MTISFGNRLKHCIARGVLRLPPAWLRRLAGPPIVVGGAVLDPQLQVLLSLQRRSGDKPWNELPVAVARRQLDQQGGALSAPAPDGIEITELALDGAVGTLGARRYRPPGLPAAAPALVFYHGGGFVLGSLASHDAPCRLLAAAAQCVVIAVDYRLAPEHPFPAGVEDALAAFRAVAARSRELGLDPGRLAIGGDSAGGNLAAVVAQETRGDALAPCFQLLWYPSVDMSAWRPSSDTYARGFYLEKPMMQWCSMHYLRDSAQTRDPRASPLLGELAGVAPAVLLVGGFDPLVDEVQAYADKLAQAGVPVRLRRYPGLIHGFFNTSGAIGAARAAFADAAHDLRAGLAAPAAGAHRA